MTGETMGRSFGASTTRRRKPPKVRSISAVAEEVDDETCGIVVEAEVEIADTVQTLRSPGVGDVEHGEDDEFLYELVEEEWETLREVLLAIGVPSDQLPQELAERKLEWRR